MDLGFPSRPKSASCIALLMISAGAFRLPLDIGRGTNGKACLAASSHLKQAPPSSVKVGRHAYRKLHAASCTLHMMLAATARCSDLLLSLFLLALVRQVRKELEQVLGSAQDPSMPRNDLPLCNLVASMLPSERWKVRADLQSTSCDDLLKQQRLCACPFLAVTRPNLPSCSKLPGTCCARTC